MTNLQLTDPHAPQPTVVLERTELLEIKDALNNLSKAAEGYQPVLNALRAVQEFVNQAIGADASYVKAAAQRDEILTSLQEKYGIQFADCEVDLETGAIYSKVPADAAGESEPDITN